MSHQNEREMAIALERRRLQKEAMAAKVPARRASGRWHQLRARTFRPAKPVGGRVQAG
ncbi:hypothetical protein ART_0224 [Arthrobacter sp. PAMC 25486]|nr:hypothetical protein ART_0224 [Arthrobacter sp. PAMC 25486]